MNDFTTALIPQIVKMLDIMYPMKKSEWHNAKFIRKNVPIPKPPLTIAVINNARPPAPAPPSLSSTKCLILDMSLFPLEKIQPLQWVNI